MAKALLNENGLKKILPYLEGLMPELQGKLEISGDSLHFKMDENIELFVRVPIMEQLPVSGPLAGSATAMGAEVAAGSPQATMPATQVAQMVSKGVDTPGVKKVGRSGIQRGEEEATAKLVEKLKKVFTSKQEFEKTVKVLQKAKDQKAKDIGMALDKVAQSLKEF